MSGVAHAHECEHDEKMADVGAQEPSDPVFGGFTAKVQMLYGDVAARERRRSPGAIGALFQTVFEWMGREKLLIVFFFRLTGLRTAARRLRLP